MRSFLAPVHFSIPPLAPPLEIIKSSYSDLFVTRLRTSCCLCLHHWLCLESLSYPILSLSSLCFSIKVGSNIASSWEQLPSRLHRSSSKYLEQCNCTDILKLAISYHVYWLILLLLVPGYQFLKPFGECLPSSGNDAGHRVRMKLMLMCD